MYDAAGGVTEADWRTDPTTEANLDPQSADAVLAVAAARGARAYDRSRITRAGRITYSYDDHARVVTQTLRTLSGQRRTTTYTWDGQGRLTRAETATGAVWTYTYDPLGRRVTKTGPSATTRFTWDGPHLVAEHNNQLSRTWHHHPGTYRPIIQTTHTPTTPATPGTPATPTNPGTPDAPGTPATPTNPGTPDTAGATGTTGTPGAVLSRAVLTDTAGTTVHLADPTTGTLTWTRTATTWGIRTPHLAPRPRTATHSTPPPPTDPPDLPDLIDLLEYCPLDHPGQYHDPETGTNDNHHRHYDPHTATYLTPDPLGLAPAPNHRTYPHNPHTWTDPHGLQRNDTDKTAETAGEESVSLFKASQRGLGESHYKNGYRAEDFPGDGAYFAREREIAESYATHYGEGVIETRVPRSVYERHFAEHEMKYLGTPPGTELAVPAGKLELLIQFGRIWHR